jgi:hypothetical protein
LVGHAGLTRVYHVGIEDSPSGRHKWAGIRPRDSSPRPQPGRPRASVAPPAPS